jgi:phosphatidylserine/phosphatidylglycerophosphate/cardiolipin synthase-like enzyme
MGRFLGTLVMVCLLVISVGSSPVTAETAVAAEPWRPSPGASFNVPRTTPELAWRSEKRIFQAINHAPRGSTIRFSIFSFDRKPMAEALIKAKKRGVYVQILLNNHQVTPAMRMLRQNLGVNRSRRSFVYVCQYGCRSTGENLHTKMYLFTKTGGASFVTMTGSHNLTANAAVNQFNDLYTVNDHYALWRTFADLWLQMEKDRPARPLYYYKNIGKRFQLQVLPFPNFSATNDPMMDILDKVRCAGATGGTGTNGRTKIRVANGAWDGVRGTYLARKIRQLYAQGCDVKLIYGLAGKSVREVFATKTKRGYIPVHVNGYDTDYDGLIDLYNHQKIITISGNWGRVANSEYTWTGSSNWNNAGAKGDEIIFRIKGEGVGDRYRVNFDYIWRERSHLARYIPYRSAYGRTAFTPADAPQPSPGGPAWEND